MPGPFFMKSRFLTWLKESFQPAVKVDGRVWQRAGYLFCRLTFSWEVRYGIYRGGYGRDMVVVHCAFVLPVAAGAMSGSKGRFAMVTVVRCLKALVVAIGMGLLPAWTGSAMAHCDTLDGPVVIDGRKALEKGDVTPILKWVKPEAEEELRDAFKLALAVRGKGKEAQELADRYFFETLVRVHRAGEGAPYTGLKPAGEVEPAIAMADKAVESGRGDDLARRIAEHAAHGIKERFAEVVAKKKHADGSVAAGREYVAAYVEFIHYVERLHRDITGEGAHHGEGGAGMPEHKH